MLIDLSSFPVFLQQSPEYSLPPHPDDLGRHTRICGTLSFTETSVTTLSLGSEKLTSSCSRVDGGGLDDDTTVLDELLYVGSRVGVANFSLLSGVEPYFSLANASDARGEALL